MAGGFGAFGLQVQGDSDRRSLKLESAWSGITVRVSSREVSFQSHSLVEETCMPKRTATKARARKLKSEYSIEALPDEGGGAVIQTMRTEVIPLVSNPDICRKGVNIIINTARP